jgi:peptidyl-prolyl cis-trans isomerase SurA
MVKLLKYFFLSFFCLIILNQDINSKENKILFKINNEIITSLDILNELRYLETINKQFKNAKKKQAFEIAKRSLIREKIKEIELKKVVKAIKLEDQYLDNILSSYFKQIKIESVSAFEKYFTSIDIDPNVIKKKNYHRNFME